ncbi:MAG: hypothetical protein ACO1N9_14335 [Flavobacterium sp.]
MKTEPRKISADEMEALFTFTRQHYVEYYDLQAELADHLANAIEAQWETDPQLAFSIALDREFKKFGIFGFTDIVAQRQLALKKRYNKMVWKYFREYFTLPKIMMTIGLTGLLYLLLIKIPHADLLALTLMGLFTLVTIGLAIVRKVHYVRRAKREGRKWLFEEIIFNAGAMTFFFTPQMLVQVIKFTNTTFNNMWVALGFSVVFVCFSIIQYILLFRIPKQAEEHLGKIYPEYTVG